jgi:hypothetical protein
MKKKMARGRKRVTKSHEQEEEENTDNDANYLIKGGIPLTQR